MKSLVGILVGAFGLFTAGAGQASTLSETDVAGGEFSSSFRAPTVVAFGFGSVTGVGGVASDDYFLFEGLPSGAQTLTLSLSAPEGYGDSYSAGGTVLFSYSPFNYEWDGQRLGAAMDVVSLRPAQELEIALDESFTGTLYLALNFTHGADLRYAISAPSNAFPAPPPGNSAEANVSTPSQVPLPPAMWLLATGVMGLAYLGRGRKRA